MTLTTIYRSPQHRDDDHNRNHALNRIAAALEGLNVEKTDVEAKYDNLVTTLTELSRKWDRELQSEYGLDSDYTYWQSRELRAALGVPE